MINIVIAKDEKKIKDVIAKLLKEDGYATPDIDTLINKIKELEDHLYKEKRGVLYRAILDTVEKPLIEHMLERTEGNQLKAARVLGINRNTIRAKIKRLGIDVDRWKV